MSWSTDLRVDVVVEPASRFQCGPFHVAAIDARGHKRDGLAFVLIDLGVLLPGDYMSLTTFPFAAFSVAEAVRTLERLLSAMDEYRVEWIIPGHGPPLPADQARAIAHEDSLYLQALEAAAVDAHEAGLSPGHSLLAVYAVTPPRPASFHFEVYGHRALNARKALAEQQERVESIT
jgi:glyoxylase-like metal-dependent hydrolase (beta-lactamase superfamily II)